MTGWQHNKPDHRDRAQDRAVLRDMLWNQHLRHPRRDPLESVQLTYALWLAIGFLAGCVAGGYFTAFILGAMT